MFQFVVEYGELPLGRATLLSVFVVEVELAEASRKLR
jgi:hypothetical protein